MGKWITLLWMFVSLAWLINNQPLPRPQQTNNEVESVLICQSKSAYAYHRHGCRGLDKCSHLISKITIIEAKAKGYRACRICYK